MKLRYLKPNVDDTDPVFAAAVAHAATIAETRDPLAAMRAALRAAGVDELELKHDVLLGELDQMKARLDASRQALADGAPAWARPLAGTTRLPDDRAA